MQIQIGATTICHGADRAADKSAGPEGLDIAAESAPQISRPIRAAAATPIDRGGLIARISFAVNRLCSSATVAAAFAVNHPITCTRHGDLVMGTVTYANAHIESIHCIQQGISVHVQYRITAAGEAPEEEE